MSDGRLERISAGVTAEPIEPLCYREFLIDPAHGAQSLFFGVIRDHNLGKKVVGVSYDVFEPLAGAVFQKLAVEALEKWGSSLRVFIRHRRGRCAVGDTAVVIAVGAPHRDEAYQASRFLIEEIKHRAPIWKKEHYEDGDSEWVEGMRSAVTEKQSPFAGAVLAGGRSRRMGRDKARLLLDGEPLVSRMVRCLEDAGAARALVSGSYSDLGHDCVSDGVADGGPGAGLAAIFAALWPAWRDNAVVVVPVDMPFLTPALVLRLARENAPAAFFEGHPLPLAIRLSESVGKVLGPGRSVRELLERLGARGLPLPPLAAHAFSNLNTPSEWDALARAREGGGAC